MNFMKLEDLFLELGLYKYVKKEKLSIFTCIFNLFPAFSSFSSIFFGFTIKCLSHNNCFTCARTLRVSSPIGESYAQLHHTHTHTPQRGILNFHSTFSHFPATETLYIVYRVKYCAFHTIHKGLWHCIVCSRCFFSVRPHSLLSQRGWSERKELGRALRQGNSTLAKWLFMIVRRHCAQLKVNYVS